MTFYEFALISLGLRTYVFYSPRLDFISANREGIISAFGYLAICLIAIQFGRNLFKQLYMKEDEREKKDKLEEQRVREVALLK